ncbi:MAG: lysophospholipid acyltransferase family protein [Saprospiraceae bacterium]|nr:lysophospholipid acyltransferase family protein [Saprospiraceae bacterium]
MFSAISKWILRLWGWKIEGQYPHELKKFVIIVVPHTSNWDFPLGLLVRSALKASIRYVGKASLFRQPFGWIFRALGGYPVDRRKRSNFVDAVVDIFNREEKFALTIAPEGTRQKVEKLKTGFYYIALGAKVPIVMVKFDWGKKIIGFSQPFYPSGSIGEDMKFIEQYYQGVKGKNAANSFG